MNKFFPAIGFSGPMTSVGVQHLVNEVLIAPKYRAYTTYGDDTLLAEFRENFGPGFGVSVVGEFDSNDQFRYEYCYPFMTSEDVTTEKKVEIEPRIREEAYAGSFDDARVGVTVIFQLQNLIEYYKRYGEGGNAMAEDRIVSTSLCALSVDGSILLPIEKSAGEAEKSRKWSERRTDVVERAMNGDNGAMQSLTLEDMDLYTAVSKHIQTEDVYTVVDSYFMPYGVECDLYSLMGEIKVVRAVKNRITDEDIYQLKVDCNGFEFWVQINKKDLYGEPMPGRRFQGVVWMQGTVHYLD